MIGQSIGRYHITEQLGQGGMATVYKAFDTNLDTEVAIKFIRREKLTPEFADKALKRFKIEAKKTAQLSHPNIVNVMDYGEHDGLPYLVMKYIRGGTLKQKLGKPMHWAEAAKLLAPIAHALEYAHEQKMLHRDVKPANILITESGQPMLSDFGVAKVLETSEDASTLTGTGVGVGTPEYMAPEQWMGKADHRTDVYALGVVFYELLTGKRPYIADTPAAILLKQAQDPLPPPKQFVRDLPEAVERVIFKALAKKAEDRYQSMSEFAIVLDKMASGINSSIAPRVVAKASTNDITQDLTPRTRRPKATSDVKLPAWVWIVSGMILIGILSVVILNTVSNTTVLNVTPIATLTLPVSSAKVETVSGTVFFQESGRPSRQLVQGQTIKAGYGSYIQAENGKAQFSFADGATVLVGANTEVELAQLSDLSLNLKETVLTLRRGVIVVNITVKQGASFKIRTNLDVEAFVVGSILGVRYDPLTQLFDADCLEGRCSLLNQALQGGQHSRTDSGRNPSSPDSINYDGYFGLDLLTVGAKPTLTPLPTSTGTLVPTATILPTATIRPTIPLPTNDFAATVKPQQLTAQAIQAIQTQVCGQLHSQGTPCP